jgi:two-component system sensor histidine kinase PhcS
VLVNLLQNANDSLREAPPAGATPLIALSARRRADRILLRVRDNGRGIPKEHLDKVFEPFFTTKDVGQGMGIGLSICYRIMRDHGGSIQVRSEPGQFCEFELEFGAEGESA